MQKTNPYILLTLILAIGFLPGCMKERVNPKLRKNTHHHKVVKNAGKMYEDFRTILQDELNFKSSITDTDPNNIDSQEEARIKRFIKKRIALIHKKGGDISFWNIFFFGDWVGRPFSAYQSFLSHHLDSLEVRLKRIKKVAAETQEELLAERTQVLIENMNIMHKKLELLKTLLEEFFVAELNQEDSDKQLTRKIACLR